jgi:hypothetical protein
MTRFLPVIMATGLLAASAEAQVNSPRSADYLFLTNVWDARALWVNPAGLGILPEASLLGEFMIHRKIDGGYKLGQFTVGFNSRGFSLGYQRDRLGQDAFGEDISGTTWKGGLAVPFRGGSIGGAMTWYRGTGESDTDFDLGLLYRPALGIVLGGAVRHIGKPTVRGVEIPVESVVGVHWSTPDGSLALLGEGHATDSPNDGDSDLDITYRGGAQISIGNRLPITVLTAFDLGSNVAIDRWHIGVRVGAGRQVTAVGTFVSRNEQMQLDRASVAGVVSNILAGRR